MSKMRAVQITRPNGAIEVVEREIPKPSPGSVRIKVQACGVCHSDSFVVEGTFPGIQYPRTPGHEVAGIIDELGAGVTGWELGQRVGIGWYGGHCGHCPSCRHGDFATCYNPLITGISFDGGYAEYMIAPANALAIIPEGLSAIDAAPLMCAGITTYNSLRNSGARAGDLVVVLGLGGLGHLATQFATKMGFRAAVVARGKDKEALAKKLGATYYIDSQSVDPANELQKLGGAKVVLAIVTNAQAMEAVVGGLGVNGKLVIVGAPSEPIKVGVLPLIAKRLSISGWPSGTSIDSEEAMNFCSLSNVRSINQVFPLEKAAEAYEWMMSGKARFRAVLAMEK